LERDVAKLFKQKVEIFTKLEYTQVLLKPKMSLFVPKKKGERENQIRMPLMLAGLYQYLKMGKQM
jgi:hypothetical protein